MDTISCILPSVAVCTLYMYIHTCTMYIGVYIHVYNMLRNLLLTAHAGYWHWSCLFVYIHFRTCPLIRYAYKLPYGS